MFRKITYFIKARLRKLFLDEYWLQDYINMGMKVGKNCSIQPGLIVDVSHCWLIEIGDNVTIAPYVYLLAHDTSTKNITGYTKIGRIIIRRNAIIGARTTIMPGVTIGEDSIVGTGSVVIRSIPDGMVAAGNPAKIICTIDEYRNKIEATFQNSPTFSAEYTLRENISQEKKDEMNNLLSDCIGFVK